MNKCLLRKLKPFFLCVESEDARQLIRAFDFLATRAKKGWMRFMLLLRAFKLIKVESLRKRSLPESQLSHEISKFETISVVWLQELATLLATFLSPAILLLLFLKKTLDNKRLPDSQKFVFEEIKQSLWDRYWPPQRQRCDFIPAPAIN
jgi:hypothetical protein